MVQVTPRTRYGVRGGDETLKRRVAAKFAEGDVSAAFKVTLDIIIIYSIYTAVDTARGHPSNPPSRSSSTPKPPLYYLPLSAQGTPFTHQPSWIFQGQSVGHSFSKDNNWNCNLFKKKICISDEKY